MHRPRQHPAPQSPFRGATPVAGFPAPAPGTVGAGTPRHRRPHGFNLLEVLVSLGVFAIGFVAIASIFPVGALLQRNAANDTLSRNVADNAKAMVEVRSLTFVDGSPSTGDLAFYHPTTASAKWYVEPFDATLIGKWTLSDRSYPSTIANAQERDIYWVPLIFDLAGDAAAAEWNMPVFVLRRDSGKTYSSDTYPATHPSGVPGLTSIAATRTGYNTFSILAGWTPNIGDQLLASSTVPDPVTSTSPVPTTYTVQDFNSSTSTITVNGFIGSTFGTGEIWFAPPADGETDSPTMKIMILQPEVVTP